MAWAAILIYLRLLAAIDGDHLALALDVDRSVHAPIDVDLKTAVTAVHKKKKHVVGRKKYGNKISEFHALSSLSSIEDGEKKDLWFSNSQRDKVLLVLLLIFSRVNFIVFVLFLGVVGAREYCCKALENGLAALYFARSPRATRASRSTNSRPCELVASGLAESRQSYVRGIVLSREPSKLQQTA